MTSLEVAGVYVAVNMLLLIYHHTDSAQHQFAKEGFSANAAHHVIHERGRIQRAVFRREEIGQV